jgi:hypothetical protein
VCPLLTWGKQLTVAQCHDPQMFVGHQVDAGGLSASDALIGMKNLLNPWHTSKTSKPANKNTIEETARFGEEIFHP